MAPKKKRLDVPEENYDFLGYSTSEPTEADISTLVELGDLQDRQAREVERLTGALTQASEKLRKTQEEDIPRLMDEIGMKEFKTSSGLIIKVKEDVRASIPKDQEAVAFEWLRSHEHAALIKRQVIVEFSVGEDEKAKKVIESLEEQELDVADKSSVHPSTLSSFIKNQLQEGNNIPLEPFGVFRQRKSVISK